MATFQKKIIKTTQLPPRTASVTEEVDVLVVGGGPAGIGAAAGAAQRGARVVLVERYGFLGGNATAALVMPLTSFHTQKELLPMKSGATLFPTDHGEGHAIISGALRDFLTLLLDEEGAISPSAETGYTVPFDPERFKYTLQRYLDELGVEVLLHAFASDVMMEDGQVHGAIFETKSGPIVIPAKSVVDCTGDADLAARAGATFDLGREMDGLMQPMTLMFRMVGFNRRSFNSYVEDHPDQWKGVHGLWDLIKKAQAHGDLDLPREDILMFGTPHHEEVTLNSTRVNRVCGIDVFDLSYAEWASRQQMKQISKFLRKYVPGFETSYVAQSGVQIGVRETRRIHGHYCLTADDLLTPVRFEDVIAHGAYPIDIHNPQGRGTLLKKLPAGEAYDIPLRSLLPKAVEGLVVAGRAICGTHEAHSSYRVMPISMATGQAAGVAAALASERTTSPTSIAYQEVQQELHRQGAYLRTHS